jgi:hypothetical protein
MNNDYDYIASDHIGRTVEIRENIFTSQHTTVLGDGTRSTTTHF